MNLFGIILLTTLATLPNVTVSKSDGSTAAGTLQTLTNTELTFSSTKTKRPQQAAVLSKLSSDEVVQIDFVRPQSAVRFFDSTLQAITLTDGSLLLAKETFIQDKRLRCTLSDSTKLELQLRKIASIRFGVNSPELNSQWNEMLPRASEQASDLLVINKSSGKSIDFIAGTYRRMGKSKLLFNMDDEDFPVKRSKIYGLIFYRRASLPLRELTATASLRNGSLLKISTLDYREPNFFFTTPSGAKLTIPSDLLQKIDYSAGKYLYLSDLKPSRIEWKPFIGFPKSAKLAAKSGYPRFDLSLNGTALTLLDANAVSGSRVFKKGIAFQSWQNTLEFALPARFQRFEAICGFPPGTPPLSKVTLTLLGDGKLLLEKEISAASTPVKISISLPKIRRLQIQVQHHSLSPILHCCDAKFVK